MIEISNVSKNYGSFRALKGISFKVNEGEILGLLGPNGAGKTTTMKILTGFLEKTGGEVKIKGKEIEKNTSDIQRNIGYLPENTPLYLDLNVFEHLEFAAEIHGLHGEEKLKAIKEVAKTCSLTDRMYFQVSELSKGYRQRVGLAQALIHNPDILILDEPTNGLDPNQIIEMRELIKSLSKKKTIILSTHIMQEVEATCDRVIMLGKGEVVAEGTPKDLTQGKENSHTVIEIIAKSTKTAIIEALNMKEVVSILDEGSVSRGLHSFVVTINEDVRPAVLKKLIQSKVEVYEFALKHQSLEEVFQELTK